MLRVLWRPLDVTPWLLTEDEFLNQVDKLAAHEIEPPALGKVSVEGLDELERIQWRAYYPNAAGLAILAQEIREGRSAIARRQARERR